MENSLKNLLHTSSRFPRIRAPAARGMAASAEFAANLVCVDAVVFRPHAETNFAFRQFLKKSATTTDSTGTNVVNQAVDIIRLDSYIALFVTFVRTRLAI